MSQGVRLWQCMSLVLMSCLINTCSASPDLLTSSTTIPSIRVTPAATDTSTTLLTPTTVSTTSTMPASPDSIVTPTLADMQEQYALQVSAFQQGDPVICGLPQVLEPINLNQNVRVFFTCVPNSGSDIGAVPARQVPVPTDEDPKRVALQALLAGTTQEEAQAGYYSIFGTDTKGIPFTLNVKENGLTVISFDSSIKNIVRKSEGRRLGIFVSDVDTTQIVTTLGQFPDVHRVAIFIGDQPLCKAIEAC